MSLLALFFGLATYPMWAQQRKQLEEKRRQLMKEIQLTTNLLNETKKNKEAALDRYVALQRQIRKRQQLIETLQTEITLNTESIEQTTFVAQALAEDVERLKQEYADIARSAFRQRMNHSSLVFVLSAESFNQAYQRVRFLQQYDEYRKKQARLILETQQTLAEKIFWLEERRVEKEQLLLEAQQQASILDQELQDKNNLLKTLKNDESRLSSNLKNQQKAHAQLNNAIETIIRDEMAKTRKEGRKSDSDGNAVDNAAIRAAESASFEGFRGKLGWPVKNGVITSYFGRQEHPTLAGVYITNNGIDIRTDANAQVHSIFNGEVVGTQFIPGFSYMVIVRHGKYYTVYSNLKEIYVERNDQVSADEVIGIVNDNPKTNAAELHFEVWKEKKRLNPVRWVKQQ
ncbi:MAG: peptidoglycan DD-metalloendopeptidase family protein [Phaeodactylibacter sp.]|nr:peptidoglycan DD-metalloendopeptidase family protein [Phaeodactylibacter sp.]